MLLYKVSVAGRLENEKSRMRKVKFRKFSERAAVIILLSKLRAEQRFCFRSVFCNDNDDLRIAIGITLEVKNLRVSPLFSLLAPLGYSGDVRDSGVFLQFCDDLLGISFCPFNRYHSVTVVAAKRAIFHHFGKRLHQSLVEVIHS